MPKTFRLGSTLAAACVLGAGPAAASGFYVQEQSARGLGRAFSGEAADVGAASLWWNPAAIAGVEARELHAGVHAVLIESTVSDTGTSIDRPGPLPASPVGGQPREFGVISDGLAPNLGGALRVSDRLVLGLSTAAPYNFTTAYGGDSFARYEALKSRLLTLDVQATAAYRLTDEVDLGLGVSAQYADATLTSALPNLSPLLADGRSSLSGDGWGVGWTAGVQLRPAQGVTLGLSYRSSVEHRLEGRVSASGLVESLAGANFETEGEATFDTPWIATAAGRWRATDRLALTAQVQRFGWSEFDAIRVRYAGGAQITRQDYKDTTSVAAGLEYAVVPGFTLRGGVQFDPTPTPDDGRTARVPDGDRTIVAAGATFQPRPRLSADVGVALVTFEDSEINSDITAFAGSPAATPVAVRGAVEGEAVILSAGLRWSF